MLNFDVKFDDKRLFERLVNKDKKVLTVGFFDEKYPDGKRIGMVATANEYGVPENNVPPRPFMRDTVITRKPKWLKIVKEVLTESLDVDRTFRILGDVIADDVSQMITAYAKPENAPSTIAKKGFNDPLVDTGLMRDSVGWKVGRE
jgi:hypothetical protein